MKNLLILLLILPIVDFAQTKIYNDVGEFYLRKNLAENGVDKQFALNNPNYINDNITNKGCWNCLSTIYSHGCYNCENCNNLHLCGMSKNCSFCYMSMGLINCTSIIQCEYLHDEDHLYSYNFSTLDNDVGSLCIQCSQCDNCDDCSIECAYTYFEIFDCPYAFSK
jgi:hypothetical protein